MHSDVVSSSISSLPPTCTCSFRLSKFRLGVSRLIFQLLFLSQYLFLPLFNPDETKILIYATISQIRLDIMSRESARAHNGTVICIRVFGLNTLGLYRFAYNESVKMRRGISFPKSYASKFSKQIAYQALY